MALPRRKWMLLQPDRQVAAALKDAGFSRVMASLLVNRGIRTPEQARAFFTGSAGSVSDPYLMKGIEKASLRIRKAIEQNEKITVYGDYDVDGVTATALLYRYLKSRDADVSYYIPQRETEGYGLNETAVRNIISQGTTLIVTVDTGISALAEAKLVKELGADLIVTDHHEPRDDLPEAYAVIDPKQPGCDSPFKELAGVGVALKLACAVEETRTLKQMFMRYGDLVCLGTVADVVPLSDENRALVRSGLNLIVSGKNFGIKALCDAAGITPSRMSAVTLSFTLAPRINACGRMGSADTAFELLTTKSPDKAKRLAAVLNDLNRNRRDTEAGILDEVVEILKQNPKIAEEPVIIAGGNGWHNGVVGIVAARVQERCGKPCILISFDGCEGRASCRSLPGFDIFEALSSCSDLLEKYGGHKLAAGFSIKKENYAEFCRRFLDFAHSRPNPPAFELPIDCELLPEELTVETARDLARLEPCGSGNPSPLFLVGSVYVQNAVPLSNGKHLKLSLIKEEAAFTGLLFNAEKYEFIPKPGDFIDIAASLEIDSFGGAESLSALIRGIRTAAVLRQQSELYGQFVTGSLNQPLPSGYRPVRAEFAAVYRYYCTREASCFPLEEAYAVVIKSIPSFNFFKLRLITDVFKETGLIKMDCGKNGYRVSIQKGMKVDLSHSVLLKNLKVENELRHG